MPMTSMCYNSLFWICTINLIDFKYSESPVPYPTGASSGVDVKQIVT